MSRARSLTRTAAFAALLVTLSWAPAAHAYKMIQSFTTGRVYGGNLVDCDDPSGFAHWGGSNIGWVHSTANQGSGKAAALQAAMASWTNVPTASYVLSYAGTTASVPNFQLNDGTNTLFWSTSSLCTGGCLALTALNLQSGQVIVESDVIFNNAHTWNTNGSNVDVQAVATHELGHTLGIHHSSISTATMYPTYSGGTSWRSLETDDQQALQCSEDWYISPAYQGDHQVTNCREISGWAWNAKRPSGTTRVQIRNGSSLLTDIPTSGPSAHSFSWTPTWNLKDGTYKTIYINHKANGQYLSNTGQSLICQVSGLTYGGTPAEFLDTGGVSWSVGNVFYSSIPGYVTNLRYYKAAEEYGWHALFLWTDGGQYLGHVDVNFGSPGSAGWVDGALPGNGIFIQANTNYVVSVTTYTKQSKTGCGFSSPIGNGPLTFHGGLWVQGDNVFPTTSSCSNFWTDVTFDQ